MKTTYCQGFRRGLVLLAAASSWVAAPPALAEPTNVLVRIPAGQAIPAGYSELLAKWRQAGQVASVLLLSDGRPEPAGETAVFESLAVLEFESEGAYSTWQRDAAPELPSSLVVRRADVLTHGERTPRDSNRSVFVVNTYTPTGPPERYAAFAREYLTPLMEGQRAGKILVRYTLYLEHAPAGEAQSFLLLEYRDDVAFAAAPAVEDKVRAELSATHPGYARFDPIKPALRADVGGTRAVYTELPPPDLSHLPAYEPEVEVVGVFRIVGSELKNAVDYLAEGFAKFHTKARISTSHIPSSEGGIAALYFNLADVAPMGDDAKITDQMPFHNTFGYLPTEISVATGGYEKRGSLFAWAIVVSKDNPLDAITVDQIERVFGAERSGGWEIVDHNFLFTARHARGPDTNIRTWDQLGLGGDFDGREIQTFGYASPGFSIAIERHLFHWSKKWNPNFMEYVEAKQATPDPHGHAVSSERPLEALAGNKHAIGIAALMHVKNQPGIKVLAVAPHAGGAAVPLTPDNVAKRRYPLIRDAYFYVNKPPEGRLDPKVREFMRFVLSREGQEIVARVGYYYPLTAAYLEEQRRKLD